MCTSLTLPTPHDTNLFGRTLDLDDRFGESVTLTPRRYPFSFADCYPHTHHYALLGMAAVVNGYPLYAEAMNEKGLCMAGLRFAKCAVYAPRPEVGFLNLAPWELIPYLLGTCATVAEVHAALGDIRIVDKPFSDTVGTAPLHWHIADADPSHGGLILETTVEGMRIYEDSPDGAGVLTNDPPYPEQLAALDSCRVQRGDTPGLPGDYSSPSRFIRAAILRRWAVERMGTDTASPADPPCSADPACPTDPTSGAGNNPDVARFFSLLAAVSPTPGAVMTPEGRCHRTLYTCCMDTATGVYHWRQEGDTEVRAVAFAECDLFGDTVVSRKA